MESILKIRRRILCYGESARSVSRSTGISRNTIKKYLAGASSPSYRRDPSCSRPKLQGYEDRLRVLYEQDQLRPSRDRRTAVSLYERLAKDGYTGSYSPVCRYIKLLKSEPSLSGAFIPLHFKAGDAMQFDWSEEHVILGGVEIKIKIAHFRLCHSRKSFLYA